MTVATLGTATVTLGDILKLKTGDIVPINIPAQIAASVDEVPVFECSYGQQGGQYALKINQFITHGGADEPPSSRS